VKKAIALLVVAILIVLSICAFTLPIASALEPTDPVKPILPNPDRNTCRAVYGVGVSVCVTVVDR